MPVAIHAHGAGAGSRWAVRWILKLSGLRGGKIDRFSGARVPSDGPEQWGPIPGALARKSPLRLSSGLMAFSAP